MIKNIFKTRNSKQLILSAPDLHQSKAGKWEVGNDEMAKPLSCFCAWNTLFMIPYTVLAQTNTSTFSAPSNTLLINTPESWFGSVLNQLTRRKEQNGLEIDSWCHFNDQTAESPKRCWKSGKHEEEANTEEILILFGLNLCRGYNSVIVSQMKITWREGQLWRKRDVYQRECERLLSLFWNQNIVGRNIKDLTYC